MGDDPVSGKQCEAELLSERKKMGSESALFVAVTFDQHKPRE